MYLLTMPYFQQQPAQPGNPVPFHQTPGSASPGWTESETNSENDQGNKKTKTDPAKDEMIYNPDQWKGSPANLSYGPVPRRKQPVTPEEVQNEGGSRFPYDVRRKPETQKPSPHPYTVNPLTFVTDVMDHPDMRDHNRIKVPPKRGEASLKVEAVSLDFMKGYVAGWEARDAEAEIPESSGGHPEDYWRGWVVGFEDQREGDTSRLEGYRQRVQELTTPSPKVPAKPAAAPPLVKEAPPAPAPSRPAPVSPALPEAPRAAPRVAPAEKPDLGWKPMQAPRTRKDEIRNRREMTFYMHGYVTGWLLVIRQDLKVNLGNVAGGPHPVWMRGYHDGMDAGRSQDTSRIQTYAKRLWDLGYFPGEEKFKAQKKAASLLPQQEELPRMVAKVGTEGESMGGDAIAVLDEVGVEPDNDWTLSRFQVAELSEEHGKRMASLGITMVSRDLFLSRLAASEGKTYFDVLVQFPPHVGEEGQPSPEDIVSEAKSAVKKAGYKVIDKNLVPDRFKEMRIFCIAADEADCSPGCCEIEINAALKERGSPASVRLVRIPRKPFMNLPFHRPVLDVSRPGAVDEKGKGIALSDRDEFGRSTAPTKEKSGKRSLSAGVGSGSLFRNKNDVKKVSPKAPAPLG